jgi:hypothetical protein
MTTRAISNQRIVITLIEESHDLASSAFVLGLVVVEDSLGGREYQVSKLTRGENVCGPAFEVAEGNVESGRDDSTLIDSAEQFDNDLARAMIVDHFKFADVAALLHELEEFDQNLRAGSKQNLTLAFAFGVQDALQGVG